MLADIRARLRSGDRLRGAMAEHGRDPGGLWESYVSIPVGFYPSFESYLLGSLALHRFLSRLDGWTAGLEIRRGFTVFQLMTILEKAHHSLILIEHDPLLYEDAREMTEYVSHALSDAAKEAAVLLYAQGIDPFFEDLVQNADRVFYFEEGPRETPRLAAKAHPRTRENQRTLEAYS